MNEYRFTAEVARHVRAGSEKLWRNAATVLRARAYTTTAGIVRVQTDWAPLASGDDVVRIDVRVIDDGGKLAARDVPSFVELFFHDAFLLFNIAAPGSFSGAITVTGGEYRVNDLAFDASAFAYGAVPSDVPLDEVVAWYRGGTEQIAATPMQKVLFHLLHIARGESDEWMLRVRLDDCLKTLGIPGPSLDVAALIHPMHDEALDERVDDRATEAIDQAMARVLTAIQDAVRTVNA